MSYDEFKLLCAEWNKTCKLLTSGNFFLTIAHTNELFHERWFLAICKDAYPAADARHKELEFLLACRLEGYFEKLRETPFLGHDFEKRPIYSLEPPQLELIRRCYGLIDPQSSMMFTR